MAQAAARTFTYKVKCVENSGLHDLLIEKKQESEEKGKDNMVRAFANAAKAVRAHPMEITNKGQFAELKHIGPFIVKQLGKYFDEHLPAGDVEGGAQGPAAEEGPPAKKRKTAAYVPRLNSAPYAILVTMYRGLVEGKEEYGREELIQDADNSGLSEKAIGPDPLNGQAGRRSTHTTQDNYTGWSCMTKQLIAKGLVLKQGSPARYSLTEYGEETARACLQRSGMVDPAVSRSSPAGTAPPRAQAPPHPSSTPAAAAAAAAEARRDQPQQEEEEGGAGPSSSQRSTQGAKRSGQPGTARSGGRGHRGEGSGSANGNGRGRGFQGLVAERPDLVRVGAGDAPAEEAGQGDDSDIEELDGWPDTTPKSTGPMVGEDTVQKLVGLGFSPVQARQALKATHVAGVLESPWVEQAAHWLFENDLPPEPSKPRSPKRPSVQARAPPDKSSKEPIDRSAHPSRAAAGSAGPSGVSIDRPESAAAAKGAPRAARRPPAVPPQRPTHAAAPSEAGPSGSAQPRHAVGPSAPLEGGACPLSVRVPPLAAHQRFDDRYTVVCLMDHREFLVRKLGVPEVVAAFAARGLAAEARNLELGDFLWIAKERNGVAEYVLDYVCERKRVDDLSLSIQSSRYQRQKHFLDTCGLRRRIYLLEDDANKMDDHQRIKTACINTELVNGFDIQRTADSRDTMRRLITLSAAIRDKMHALGEDAPRHAGGEALPTFVEFDQRGKQSRKRTVKDLWGLMLTQVGGIGNDSANVIMQEYPTAKHLFEAYRQLEGKPMLLSQQLVAKFVRNAGALKVGNKASENLYKFMYDSTPPEEPPEVDA